MNTFFTQLLALALLLTRTHALESDDPLPQPDILPQAPQDLGGAKYELKKVFEVEGRQGIANNGTHYFNSGSKGLYVYDMEGQLLMKNENPFAELNVAANHFGDISYYNDEIITGVEWFEDGRGEDIQIVKYDPGTLEVLETIMWESDSGQVEVSGVGVDTDKGLAWMTDWVNSRYIYYYDITTGDYTGKLHLRATPTWSQGITYYKGDLYITADDGNADRKEDDNIWRVDGKFLTKNSTYIHHELSLPVLDYGEIEGLTFNKDTNELLVLSNRGKQIILGMPKDYYPGYDREIHDVYVFSILDGDTADNNYAYDGYNRDLSNADINSSSSATSVVIAMVVTGMCNLLL